MSEQIDTGDEEEDFGAMETELLLYFETRALKHAGMFSMNHLNKEEKIITRTWKVMGLIEFRKVLVSRCNDDGNYAVKLSDEALFLAFKIRFAIIRATERNLDEICEP